MSQRLAVLFLKFPTLKKFNEPKFYMADVRITLSDAGKQIFYLKTNSCESLMQIQGAKKIIRYYRVMKLCIVISLILNHILIEHLKDCN